MRAVKEVLIEKKSKPLKDINPGQRGDALKYLYEIELFSGGWIFTENVTITDKEVTYISDKGLIISLNKDDVKTMKKKSR